MRKVGDKVRLRMDLDWDKRYRMYDSNNDVAMARTIINFLQGKVLTISNASSRGYFCEETGSDFVFTDEMFEKDVETLNIMIYRDGRKMFAEDLETHEVGIAICNPEDEFNPEYGAIIAIHRMFGKDSSLIIVKEGETDGN